MALPNMTTLPEEGQHSKNDFYKNAFTFEDALELNIAYLNGEGVRPPYRQDDFVDEETIPLLPKLIRLNTRGFLSLDGQPALSEHAKKFRHKQTGQTAYKSTLQKSYICGVVPREVGAKLLKFLEKRSSVYMSVYNMNPLYEMAYNYPCRDYVLTRDRVCANKEDLELAAWHDGMTVPSLEVEDDLLIRPFQEYPPLYDMLKNECVQVNIACKDFGRGSVEDLLLKFFTKKHSAPKRRFPPTTRTNDSPYADVTDAGRVALQWEPPPTGRVRVSSIVEEARQAAKAELQQRIAQRVKPSPGAPSVVERARQAAKAEVQRRIAQRVKPSPGAPSVVERARQAAKAEVQRRIAQRVKPSPGAPSVVERARQAATAGIQQRIAQRVNPSPGAPSVVERARQAAKAEVQQRIAQRVKPSPGAPSVVERARQAAKAEVQQRIAQRVKPSPGAPSVVERARQAAKAEVQRRIAQRVKPSPGAPSVVERARQAATAGIQQRIAQRETRRAAQIADRSTRRPPTSKAPSVSLEEARRLAQAFQSPNNRQMDDRATAAAPRAGDDSTTFIAECDIHPEQLKDFEYMFAVNVPFLTPCQTIGRELVSHCVPPEEINHYTFEKTLGLGSYGFVFQCLYKGKEPRAVKMVFVIEDKNVKIPDEWAYGISPVTEGQLRQEFDTHCNLARAVTPSSGFNVLKIFGDLAVFKPPQAPSAQFKLGVYIMQSLPFPTLRKVLLDTLPTPTPEVLANIAAIPRVINRLHQHGYAHSDMHSDNIAFDPTGTEHPIVLDFGRTVHISSTFKTVEAASIYCLLDYAASLGKLVGSGPFAITSFNVMAKSMDVGKLLARVSPDVRDLFRTVFSPLSFANAKKREKLFESLMRKKMLPNGTLDLDSFEDIVNNLPRPSTEAPRAGDYLRGGGHDGDAKDSHSGNSCSIS